MPKGKYIRVFVPNEYLPPIQKVDPIVTQAIQKDVERDAWLEWAQRGDNPMPTLPPPKSTVVGYPSLYAMFAGYMTP